MPEQKYQNVGDSPPLKPLLNGKRLLPSYKVSMQKKPG